MPEMLDKSWIESPNSSLSSLINAPNCLASTNTLTPLEISIKHSLPDGNIYFVLVLLIDNDRSMILPIGNEGDDGTEIVRERRGCAAFPGA